MDPKLELCAQQGSLVWPVDSNANGILDMEDRVWVCVAVEGDEPLQMVNGQTYVPIDVFHNTTSIREYVSYLDCGLMSPRNQLQELKDTLGMKTSDELEQFVQARESIYRRECGTLSWEGLLDDLIYGIQMLIDWNESRALV